MVDWWLFPDQCGRHTKRRQQLANKWGHFISTGPDGTTKMIRTSYIRNKSQSLPSCSRVRILLDNIKRSSKPKAEMKASVPFLKCLTNNTFILMRLNKWFCYAGSTQMGSWNEHRVSPPEHYKAPGDRRWCHGQVDLQDFMSIMLYISVCNLRSGL